MFEFEKGQPARVKPKASKDELESYFFEIFQDYDEERVYPSDIKKIIQWYNVLVGKGLLVAEAAPADESEAPTEEPTPTEEA